MVQQVQGIDARCRPATLHENNHVACYFDCSPGVTVFDLLPSTLVAWCFTCGDEILMPTFQRGRRVEKNCPQCHTKLAFSVKSISLTELDPERRKLQQLRHRQQQQNAKTKGDVVRMGGIGGNGQMVRLVEGNPLPISVLASISKSLRWLRFSWWKSVPVSCVP